jgi:hypothetical protein
MKRGSALATCALLASAGSILAQTNTGPTGLDHFNCYFAAQGLVQPVLARLQDQFDAAAPAAVFLPGSFETVTDIRPALFCNPVQKTFNGVTTPILFPTAHLLMYTINPQPSTVRQVTVTNQFGGGQTLHTGRAEILAVPSGKSAIAPSGAFPGIPPIPSPQFLDHFKCYQASGEPVVKGVVTLKDQFQTSTVELLRPVLFCNPVEKVTINSNAATAPSAVITPILHPTLHLTCYLTTPVPFQQPVVYNNQFVMPGTVPTLLLIQSELLCVPSLKQSWSVIPPPASTNPAGGN